MRFRCLDPSPRLSEKSAFPNTIGLLQYSERGRIGKEAESAEGVESAKGQNRLKGVESAEGVVF